MPLVARPVALQLSLPEGFVRAGGRRKDTPPVPMPEASMYKHGDAESGQHDVRPPGQLSRMEPETKPPPVKVAA